MSMSMSAFIKHCTRAASIIGLLGVSTLVSMEPARALLKSGSFETGDFSGWDTAGDTSIQGNFQGIAPPEGSSQAVLSTACPGTAFSSGECFDTNAPDQPRNDDPGNSPGTFNFSGNDQFDANAENFPNNLQGFLGLGPNALNIPREGGIPGLRLPKEGSAIKQTFTAEAPFQLSFEWNLLTNDVTGSGNSRDLAFATIYESTSTQENRQIINLNETITTLDSSSTTFAQENGYQSFTSSQTYSPGTYTLGFGVVDIDGVDTSSALMVDSVEVPFEGAPGVGLGVFAGVVGLHHLWRKRQQKSEIE